MKTAFHGTSADVFKKILKSGELSTRPERRNWNESNNAVYMWAMESNEDEQERRDDCLQKATDSAEMALLESKDCRRVVLEINIEGLKYNDDNSCANMDGAIECFQSVPASRIIRVWIDGQDLSLFKMMIAQTLLNHDMVDVSNYPTLAKMSDYLRRTIKRLPFEFYWAEDFQVEEVKDWKGKFPKKSA